MAVSKLSKKPKKGVSQMLTLADKGGRGCLASSDIGTYRKEGGPKNDVSTGKNSFKNSAKNNAFLILI